MSFEKRSSLMSKIKAKNTTPERTIIDQLTRLGLEYQAHDRTLPGKPDVVFYSTKVAIFIDGDFWHGWHFSQWKTKLTAWWQKKIGDNIKRDQRNMRKLRGMGWKIIRIWEHQIENDPKKAISTILSTIEQRFACQN